MDFNNLVNKVGIGLAVRIKMKNNDLDGIQIDDLTDDQLVKLYQICYDLDPSEQLVNLVLAKVSNLSRPFEKWASIYNNSEGDKIQSFARSKMIALKKERKEWLEVFHRTDKFNSKKMYDLACSRLIALSSKIEDCLFFYDNLDHELKEAALNKMCELEINEQ